MPRYRVFPHCTECLPTGCRLLGRRSAFSFSPQRPVMQRMGCALPSHHSLVWYRGSTCDFPLITRSCVTEGGEFLHHTILCQRGWAVLSHHTGLCDIEGGRAFSFSSQSCVVSRVYVWFPSHHTILCYRGMRVPSHHTILCYRGLRVPSHHTFLCYRGCECAFLLITQSCVSQRVRLRFVL